MQPQTPRYGAGWRRCALPSITFHHLAAHAAGPTVAAAAEGGLADRLTLHERDART
jgi:hypothetical protein